MVKGAGALAQEQIVEFFGVGFAKGPEFVGDGEGEQEVVEAGQEACFLFGTPAPLVEPAALRAIAVVATAVGEVLGLAGLAAVEMPTQGGGAAVQHGAHRPVVGGDEP